MRRALVMTVLLLACAATAMAGEAQPGQFNVTFGGGINVPSKDATSNGYQVGGGLGYHLTSRLVVGADLAYLGYQRDEFSAGSGAAAVPYYATQHFLSYTGSARYTLREGRTAPYVKGFLGGYRYAANLSGAVSGSYTHDDLAYGGGVGVLVHGQEESNLFLELGARQIALEVGRTRIYSFTVGMDVNFLP